MTRFIDETCHFWIEFSLFWIELPHFWKELSQLRKEMPHFWKELPHFMTLFYGLTFNKRLDGESKFHSRQIIVIFVVKIYLWM